MNKNRLIIGLLALLLSITGCRPRTPEAKTTGHCVKEATLPIKYAAGFTVDYYNGFKVITVKDVRDTGHVLVQYVLLPKGKPAPVDFKNAIPIDTPATKVVCISTTHTAALQRLNLIDKLAGVTNLDLIYDSTLVSLVKNGKVANLGTQEMNYEKLVELGPSFVFSSGSYDGGDKMKSKLDALGIKTVLNLDYMEQEPLARAEWLKFTAAFFDAEYEADSIFKAIEANYLSLKQKVAQVAARPTVFCNIPFKEVWYMPCGENYMAILMADAGGNFLWNDAVATNGLNLNLDYEAVYAKAAGADYWVNPGFAQSLNEIKAADKKNALFKAYQTGMVYNNNLRNTPAGGFDFWESGVVNPDVILADLIAIFHPGLLPNHQLYYYRKLN